MCSKSSKGKVIQAAQKLQQQLADSSERLVLLSGNAERPALAGSSNDRADGQNDPAANQDPVLATLKERQRKKKR